MPDKNEKPEILNRRFALIKILGRGGSGITHLARDENTGRHCAVKCLSLKQADTWKSIELFEREAKILSHVRHPQIPGYIDFFTIHTDSDTRFYLVQEYIEGQNLQTIIQSGKHFTETEVIKIAIGIADILIYLHYFSPPVIHRDLKPSNILLTPYAGPGDLSRSVYIIDFGAVRNLISIGDKASDTVIGTFGYMPPEQFDGQAFPPTDIYSLGATLIYLLSHKDPSQIEKNKLRMDFRSHVSVSEDLSRILEHMVEPDWKDRFATAVELKQSLLKLGKSPLSHERERKAARAKKAPKKAGLFLAIGFSLLALFSVNVMISLFKEGDDKGSVTQPVTESDVKPDKQIERVKDDKTVPESTEEQNRRLYLQARDALSKKEYDAAAAIFKQLKDYRDAKQQYEKTLILKESAARHLKTLQGHGKQTVNSLVFIQDGGRLISSCYDNTIRLWSVNGGEELKSVKGPAETIYAVALHPAGKILASGNSEVPIIYWSTETWEKLINVNGHKKGVKSLCFSPDAGFLASSSFDNSVRLWDAATGKEIKTIDQGLLAHSLAFSEDGKMFACAYEDHIRVFDVASWGKILRLETQKRNTCNVVFSPDGQSLFSSGPMYKLIQWSLASGKQILVLNAHSERINCIALCPSQDLIASGSDDRSITIWSIKTRGKLLTLSGFHEGGVCSLAFSPDGKILASGGDYQDSRIHLWSLENIR